MTDFDNLPPAADSISKIKNREELAILAQAGRCIFAVMARPYALSWAGSAVIPLERDVQAAMQSAELATAAVDALRDQMAELRSEVNNFE